MLAGQISLSSLSSSLLDPYLSMEAKEYIITQIRKTTCTEENPPLQEIIDAGIVYSLVKLEQIYALSSETLLNILWILSNLCSGNSKQTEILIYNHGLDLFIKYCMHQNLEIVVQSLWGIGNIAGDSILRRNQVLRSGCAQIICNILDSKYCSLTKNHVRTLAWVISNLVRGKPKAEFQDVEIMIPQIIRLLQENDQEIVLDSIWAISYISEYEQALKILVSHKIASYIRILLNEDISILIPAIRTLGNLGSRESYGVDHIMYEGCIPLLIEVGLRSEKDIVRKEVAWAVSNIAAGTEEQQEYLTSLPVFHAFIEYSLQNHIQSFQVSKEVYWIIANLSQGSNKSIMMLFQQSWDQKILEHILNLQVQFDETGQAIFFVFIDGLKTLVNKNPNRMNLWRDLIVQVLKHLENSGFNVWENCQQIIRILNLQYCPQCFMDQETQNIISTQDAEIIAEIKRLKISEYN